MTLLKLEQQQAIDLHIALVKRRSDLDTEDQIGSVAAFDRSLVNEALAEQNELLTSEAKSLNDFLQDSKRQQMEERLLRLKAIQWLSQNKPFILIERDRLLAVDQYGKAIRLSYRDKLSRHTLSICIDLYW